MASEFLRGFAGRLVLAAVALLAAQWIFMPGYLALDTPSHSDLWRYYASSQEQTLREAIVSPRPLMLVFLHLMKIFKSPEAFFVALNLPAIMFASSLSMAMEKMWGRTVPSMLMGCCYVVVFSMPTFYELNPLDFGGMLAGVVFSLALFWVADLRDRNAGIRVLRDSVIFGLLSFISVETKPTFIIIFPFVPFLLYGYSSRRNIFIMSLASIAAMGCSVAKDLLLNSPFISFSGAHANPYYVGHDPRPMLVALVHYASCIAPAMWLPVIFLSIYLAMRKSRLLALSIAAAPILVVAPMGAIPTRVLPMYSWFATIILVLSALCALRVFLTWKRRWILALSMIILFIPAVFGAQPNQGVVPWIMANQAFNRNSLKGLYAILERVEPGERVLIVGSFMPYSPFQNDQFIRLVSHVPFDWKVAYPAIREPFVAMSKDTRSMIPQASVDLRQFDRVAIFASDGQLKRFSTAHDFTGMTTWDLEAAFYCSSQLSIMDVANRAAQIMSCLNDIGEFNASVEYGSNVPLAARNQWTWFMYGRANEGIRNYGAAYDSYEHAYAIEHAQVFKHAMDNARENSGKM